RRSYRGGPRHRRCVARTLRPDQLDGIPAQFTDARYLAAVERIAEAGKQNGKAAGFMASSAGEAASMLEKGYRCLAYWGDIWIYGQALRSGIEGTKKAAAAFAAGAARG